jgi:hypothetical protein
MTLPANEKPQEKNIFETILARRSVHEQSPDLIRQIVAHLFQSLRVKFPVPWGESWLKASGL